MSRQGARRHPRTAVIGGGIAGLCVALALRARGAPVTVGEAGPPGGRATLASAGMLAPQYEAEGADALLRLGVLGLQRYPAFASRVESLSGRRVHFRQEGLLVANFEGQEAAAREAAAWQRRAGLEAELLDPVAARSLEPNAGKAASFLWLPRQARVDSQALGPALVAAAEAAGARLVAAAVTSVRSRRGRVAGVELEGGRTLDAECVVVAAGAWTAAIHGLPRPVPVRPVRGQMIRYRPGPAGLSRLVADHGGRYVVPRDDGSALAGSTMEEAGFDETVTREGLERIREGVFRLVPSLRGAPEAESWAGLRPLTPDGRPILGPDPALEGLFYATGYGRNGILLAPEAGRLLAELILAGKADADLSPFLPERFA